MKYISILLNHLSIISKFLSYKNKFSNSPKTNNEIILIELCPLINLQTTFHILVSLILIRKFKIIFFYFGGYKINLFTSLLRYFLKKKNFEVINLSVKPKIKNNIKKFKSLKQCINYNYKGYKIGKYIYQSYCRLYLKSSLNLEDEKLYKLVSLSHAQIDYLENFFLKKKIKYLITTHVVFVNYGPLALVAKKYETKIKIIYPEKNYSYIRTLSVDKKNLLQIDKYYEYKKEFKKKKNKSQILRQSREELIKRIYKNKTNWKVGNVASYSKRNILKIKSNKPKIVIMPSCFFDAHHFFRYSLFPDVYQWMDFTLNHASKTDFEWFVKPHPNNLPINFNVYKFFEKKYPTIRFLDSNTSNLTFKKNKFASMFTFQSSAVHEFAFMNIPSVVVTDNVSVNYKFGQPIKSINDYKKLIYKADQIKNRINLKDVLEFNYMWRFSKSTSFREDTLDEDLSDKKNNLFSFKNSLNILNEFNEDKLFKKNTNKVMLEIFK